MNNYLLNKLVPLALGIIVLSGCSKEEDAVAPVTPGLTSNLEEVSLSFAEAPDEEVVSVPESMAASDDPYAQSAVAYVTMVNQIESYLTYFQPPADAKKSAQPIVSENGRTASSEKQYLVYTWSQQDVTIAYQLSEEKDTYVWEIFWKQGNGNFKRYVYAEENKGLVKKGKMDVYNIFGGTNELLVKYAWEKKNDGVFVLSGMVASANALYTITVNPDASGSVEYVFDTSRYVMRWDGAGNGSWTLYSEDEEAASGVWLA